MLQHQRRIVIKNWSVIILRNKLNNLFAINMYTVVYILCQKANPYAYMHVQYAYALYTYTGI